MMESSIMDAPIEVFRAIGDSVRWSIIAQLAAVDELPCADLEQTLPVSKPTISYHAKILQQAGLLSVRKEGRNYFYALRRDVLRDALDELGRFAPLAVPVPENGAGRAAVPARRRAERPAIPSSPQPRSVRRKRGAVRAASDEGAALLTW
ncbi:MAG: putative ArsR family transcriptional regulator [Actinomycetia bacterium]|nr:putative ArsR family transcriptional regulator [Actinomycetes bacterium]